MVTPIGDAIDRKNGKFQDLQGSEALSSLPLKDLFDLGEQIHRAFCAHGKN